jgi:NAD(P)-dependent dehydrogenase (short-subunit alcohol dehydrogenase family)
MVNDIGTDPHGRVIGTSGVESAADKVVSEIRAAGGVATACHETCATREGGAAIIEAAITAYGRLDVLIHNAGFLRNAPFESMTDEQIRAIFDVHILGAFYLGQPAYRHMKQQGYGRILLVSSASGMFGARWQANYGAAKTALLGLMNNVAQEGKRHGIYVNTVLPNAFGRLGRSKDEWPSDFFDDAPREMQSIVPDLRNEFVVPLVVWLASERCQSTQAAFTAAAGRFARVFVGESHGWLANRDELPSPEDIERHFPQINDTARFDLLMNVFDEFKSIIEARRAGNAN